MYRLEYVETRKIDEATGKIYNLPIDKFKYIPLSFKTENFDEAMCIRCELCEVLTFGYVHIIDEDGETSEEYVHIIDEDGEADENT